MNGRKDTPTLRVNTNEPLTFTYKKKTFKGFKGDTIASALFAGGIRIFSRSLKYHRPRGLYSLDGECSNTSMEINGIPNVNTEKMLLNNGMQVKAQNVKGSPELDAMGFMDSLDRAMPAGFYYRSMHKPARIWPIALQQVRKAAGLGRISPDFRMTGEFDEIFPSTDICVIGGGPSGMTAAIAAAEAGLRVILLEARPWLGGYYDYRQSKFNQDLPLYQRARELEARIQALPNIRVFRHTAMVGAYSNNLVTAFQIGAENDPFDERYLEIRAHSIVVATGCIERPLLFENNERPGVMQIACAHRLANTYGILPGNRAVFSIAHDLGIEAAIDLCDAGLDIAAVADIRDNPSNEEMVAELEKREIPYLRGWVAQKANGSPLKQVSLTTLQGTFDKKFECDLLVASAGMTPVTGPLSLVQAEMAFDQHTGFFLPRSLPDGVYAAGRLLGLNDSQAIEASGRVAGLSAVASCGKGSEAALDDARQTLAGRPQPEKGCNLVMAPVKGRKAFICFDEDTTVKNIKQAIAMGFDATELIKRFTAAGTGPGQSGIPGHNLPLLVAQHHTEHGAITRPTTMRAPLVPTLLATYAGTNHLMSKRTPMHDLQKQDGGIMRKIGVWNRARYFSDDVTCRREIENVRSNVGMLDATTLGKFRIFGPDALKALQRVYVGDMAKIIPGKIKYSAMCNEDGCIIDDGVVVQRGDDDYYFTTSTARAGGTVEWIRFHTRYDGWDFNMVNLTDAFGVINLAGPKAREVLSKIIDADISNEAFPFAAYKEFTVLDTIPVRAMRLGFVGELSYELHVPSSWMETLWNTLCEAGKPFGITNFGLEAQNVLRMEKGHLIIGSESEQRTTLHDVGLGGLWNREKPIADTVGSVALQQTENQEKRLKLAGIKVKDTRTPPKDGSIVVDDRIRGHVCIARYSHTLQEAVGMALVEEPLNAVGTELSIYEDDCQGQLVSATVVPMPFYDPKGERMRT